MKTVLKLLLLLGLTVYLVFAFTRFNKPDETTVCKAVNVTIKDSSRAGFITADEVRRLLKTASSIP